MSIRISSLLFLILLSYNVVRASKPLEVNIVKKISKTFKRKYGKSTATSTFLHYNLEATKNQKFSNVFKSTDTFFVINQYGSVSGRTYCMVWNKRDTISYISDESSIKISKDKIYNNQALKIISQWDITLLNSFSKIQLLDVGSMYVARIVFDNNSYIVDCCILYQQEDWQ